MLSVKGLTTFAPGKNLSVEIKHGNGAVETIEAKHTYNEEQSKWFQAGSALNLLRDQAAKN